MTKLVKFHQGGKGVAFAVRVIPKGCKNEIVEILENGCLKIRVSAPPIEGKANQAVIELFAKIFNIKPAKVEILAGEHSRDKIISVMDVDPEEAERIIREIIK